MQALIFEAPEQMSLQEIPCPSPSSGEVLIQVHSASICGTDLRIFTGRKTRDVRVGHPIGHECAGVVAGIGKGVNAFHIGDRVGLCPVVSCGECEYCRADHENLCETRITLGYHTDGAFAEYMLIPARAVQRGNLFKLPDSVSLEIAPLLEPMGCCINGQHEMRLHEAAASADNSQPRLAIFGAGPIGLMHLLLAKTLGNTHDPKWHVTVVEPKSNRRDIARTLGADEVLSFDDFQPSANWDAAILAVGVTDLVPVAIRALRKGGKLNLFAGFDAGAQVTIDPNIIHYRQLQVTGASESRRRDFAEALELAARGRIRLEPLLTQQFALADYHAAFQTAASGSAIKVAFTQKGVGSLLSAFV